MHFIFLWLSSPGNTDLVIRIHCSGLLTSSIKIFVSRVVNCQRGGRVRSV